MVALGAAAAGRATPNVSTVSPSNATHTITWHLPEHCLLCMTCMFLLTLCCHTCSCIASMQAFCLSRAQVSQRAPCVLTCLCCTQGLLSTTTCLLRQANMLHHVHSPASQKRRSELEQPYICPRSQRHEWLMRLHGCFEQACNLIWPACTSSVSLTVSCSGIYVAGACSD